MFERYLARGRQPDVDSDFSNQEAMFKYLQDTYGKENVARIASFGTLSAKNIVRKTMSCFGYSMEEIKTKTSLFPDVGGSLEETYNTSEEFRQFADSIGDIYKVMQRLEGVKCNESIHAGGMVICKDIIKLLPVKYECDMQGERNIPVILMDKKTIERTQVKFDLLGLETISVVESCMKLMIEDGIDIDLDNIDFEDKKIYNMLQIGDVSGVFQLSNQAGKVMEQQPKNFRDLIAINALIRPGCSDWNEYLERRGGKEYYTNPDRQKYTKETYGLLVYQEQFMLDCKIFAGWDLAIADKKVRKNKDIKNDIELKEKFLKDSTSKGYNLEEMKRIWKDIEDAVSGGYSFNKSHATAYAKISYKTAYLKCKYPIYWYCALLNSNIKDQDKVVEYIAECNKKNIKILAPDLNKSEDVFIITNGAIRVPINYLKGVGDKAIQGIKKIRPIKDFDDLMERRNKSEINKTAIIACIKAGCFDFEEEDRSKMIFRYDMTQRTKTQIKEGYTVASVEYNNKIKLSWEKEVFGMYLSEHPLKNYNPQKIEDVSDREELVQVIEVMEIAERVQKNGRKFAFVNGQNNFGVIKCLCFADAWERLKGKFKEDDTIFIRGVRSGTNIIIDDIEVMNI